MILNSQAVSSLLKATDKAIPQAGDSDLHVPPALLMTHDPLTPIDVLAAVNFTSTSFVTEYNKELGAAAAAGSDALFILNPGLWTIDMSWFGNSNGFQHRMFLIALGYQGFAPMVGGVSYFNGQISGGRKFRVLLREAVTMTISWKATGAGENANLSVSSVVTRHL